MISPEELNKEAQKFLKQGKHQDAIRTYFNLANVLLASNQASPAIQCYQKILTLEPDNINAMLGICNSLVALERHDEAIEGYRRILEIAPDHLDTLADFGSTLLQLHRHNEAIELCEHIHRYYPDAPEPYATKANIYSQNGDWQKAQAILKPLIEKHPLNYEVVEAYYYIARRADEAEKTITLLQQLQKQPNPPLSQDQESKVNFYLGKLYDAKCHFDDAFKHFEKGNNLQTGSYDIKKQKTLTELLINNFTKEFISTRNKPKQDSQQPVFIVGMPRSGTSLVEQILDSHSLVVGAGELGYIEPLIRKGAEINHNQQPFPECLTQLTSENLDLLAGEYLSKIENKLNSSRYVTDKTNANYLHLGFITQLFPKAHIIHCQRNPLDTCLSCYFQEFTSGQAFTQDLEILAQNYLYYKDLMTHWLTVIDTPIFNLQYEQLITEPENTVSHLLDYLDLPWEENCLRFYKNRRFVDTASEDQVRQPLYTKSIGRWRNYEKHIQPLINILGEKSSW
jgi:tetratricopeptide (TPR) repeat protein